MDWLKQSVLEVDAAAHGSPDHAELLRLGIAPESLLDFSANLNPFGASPHVAPALQRAAVASYPDRHCGELRRALAKANGVEPENVLVGNGSSEIIYLLAFASRRPALIIGPSFSEYARAAAVAGLPVTEVRACLPELTPPVDAAVAAVAAQRPGLVFLCNPNNPTGAYLGPQEVGRMRDAVRSVGGLLVLDEAYVDFLADPWNALEMGLEGLLILRSLTKLHGLAGLRLGYALATAPVIRALTNAQPPWSVSSFALAAGLAALADTDHLARSRSALLHEQARLRLSIEAIGYRSLPSATNFFLVHVGCARALRQHLLEQRLLVRDCASFGLPEHIRLSARTPEAGDRLLSALTRVRNL